MTIYSGFLVNSTKNILNVLKKFQVILYFAKSDTEARYRRSVLGPFWLTLGTVIGVLGLGVIWSQILNIESAEFVPNLTIGLICWQLFSGCVVESPSVFVRYTSVIRNSPQPFIFYPVLLVSRYFVNFAHNFIIIIGVLLFYQTPFNVNILLFFPFLFLVLINLVFLSLILGVIGARFRDLEPTIASIMPLLFFVTPIFYKPSQIKIASWVIDFNPMTYYIAVIREPLLGSTLNAEIVYGFSIITIVVVGFGLFLLNAKKHRLAFWL
ncbi:ABC transporter permease [Neisseria sp. Ec49-e6-T10]|uniref:ABC transporter permease n=1 Tax=Neisseria sp. Ec49-e6-T10 TaxID=3140744 RepID=UPI003EBE471A